MVGIFGYLIVYFFIYSGCEELIEFWVLGNLCIMIAFSVARIAIAFFKHGREGINREISKRYQDNSIHDKTISSLHDGSNSF